MAERYLLLLLHDLERQDGVPRAFFDLAQHLHLSHVPHDKKAGASKPRSDEHEQKEELRAQSQVGRASQRILSDADQTRPPRSQCQFHYVRSMRFCLGDVYGYAVLIGRNLSTHEH